MNSAHPPQSEVELYYSDVKKILKTIKQYLKYAFKILIFYDILFAVTVIGRTAVVETHKLFWNFTAPMAK